MTMKQLALVAGVSVATVSKAFSFSKEISKEQRERIFSIAKENGCYDKYLKPYFGKKVIGVICPEYDSDYYSQMLNCLKKEAQKHQSIIVTACYDFDKDSQNELVCYFTECAKVDGLIMIGSFDYSKNVSIPTMTVGKSDNSDSISLSMKYAIDDAVEYLKENGHKDIAFIGERLTELKSGLFAESMTKCGLWVNGDYVIQNDERFEQAGYNAMNKLLALENPPTAVIAAYDHIAIGAMKSIYEHNLSVPDDISIIGMDDTNVISYLNVPLTSITSYLEDLCEIVMDTLFDRIENNVVGKIKKINVSTELVKRGSVAKVRR